LLVRVAQQPIEGNDLSLFQANVALTLRREAKVSADPALLRQADALLAKAQANPPQSNRSRLALAGMLAGAGRAKEAMELARGIPASDAETRALLVDIFAAGGDLDGAEREARELARLKPEDWEARFKLASVLGWNRKYKEASELYKLLAAERPNDLRIPERLAQVALWGGSFDDALARFRAMLESGNRSNGVLTGFIDAAASAKSVRGEATRKAVLVAYDALKANAPDDPVMVGRLAWVMTRVEDHVRSAELLRKALELDPTSRAMRLRLARALTEAGQFAEADKHYKILLRTAPGRGP
jgi:tetratricopeptide (TPR) repeat protein